MHREKKKRGSKWEPNWIKRCNRSQIDQGEVLDDYYHVTSALIASILKVTLLQLLSFLDTSFTKRRIIKAELK